MVMIVAFPPSTVAHRLRSPRDENCADPQLRHHLQLWATKAFGQTTGWIGGRAIIVADVIVMANLAQIAGRYSVRCCSARTDPSTLR